MSIKKKIIKEIHGVENASRIAVSVDEDGQRVSVRDGYGEVVLSLSTTSYPAGLTTEQARFIAKLLVEAADRIEQTEETG